MLADDGLSGDQSDSGSIPDRINASKNKSNKNINLGNDLENWSDSDLEPATSSHSITTSEYDSEKDYDSECCSDGSFYKMCEDRTSFA